MVMISLQDIGLGSVGNIFVASVFILTSSYLNRGSRYTMNIRIVYKNPIKYRFIKAIVLPEQSAKVTSFKYIPIPSKIHENLKLKVIIRQTKRKHLNLQFFKNYSNFNWILMNKVVPPSIQSQVRNVKAIDEDRLDDR
jgi:hypothetical protein